MRADRVEAGLPVEPALARALADELVALTGRLSDLAYDLGSEPATLRRHMDSLQSVDATTQSLVAIADILRSDAPVAERIAGVLLEDLGRSLGERYDRHRGGAA